jgi:ribulose-phosphate 3-epimerase
MKYQIGASILSANYSNLANEIMKIEKSKVDFIHFDVIDTSFANFISFGSLLIKSLRNLTNLPFNVHCYVLNPLKCINKIIDAGADSITIQIEINDDPIKVIKYIKQNNIKAGIALLPETSHKLLIDIIDEVDFVNIVSIDLFSYRNWQFIESQFKKISIIHHFTVERALQIDLQVDGGVTLNNAAKIIKAGANVLVVGSALFKSKNIVDKVEAFKKIMKYQV